MMINKQHFGWGGTDAGLDGKKERERERMWQCWANKTQGLFFLTWDSFGSFKMYVWSWGSAEHKLFEKDWCKSGAGDEREAKRRERERGLGEDRKGSMRKTCADTARQIYGKSMWLYCKTRKYRQKDRKEASSGTRRMLQHKFNMQLIWNDFFLMNEEIKGQIDKPGWGRTSKRKALIL